VAAWFADIGSQMASKRLPVSAVRERLWDVLDDVAVRGERVVIQRHGKDAAVMISADDARLLEALEDRYDALRSIRTRGARGSSRVPTRSGAFASAIIA
jgi:prevent-host-death family protein